MSEQNELNEDMLEEIVIDFDQLRDPELKESFLRAFGFMVKGILKRMFGGHGPVRAKVKGTPSEIKAFARAMGSEKDYLATLRDYGLDNPRSVRSKSVLRKRVHDFERKTGLKWPFEV
tara:strand:- start:31 stop:384 length:354 start_codon:yes stop_codon:yes gene_type:complete